MVNFDVAIREGFDWLKRVHWARHFESNWFPLHSTLASTLNQLETLFYVALQVFSLIGWGMGPQGGVEGSALSDFLPLRH